MKDEQQALTYSWYQLGVMSKHAAEGNMKDYNVSKRTACNDNLAESYNISVSLIVQHAVQSNTTGVTTDDNGWVERITPMGNSRRGTEMQPIEACPDRKCIPSDTMVRVNTCNRRKDSIKYCWLSQNILV